MADSGEIPGRIPRAHLRVAIDVFVRIAGADRDYPFRTRDLSEGGIFLSTRVGHLYPFALDDVVSIELHDGVHVLTLTGRIVRVVRHESAEADVSTGFGIRLTELDELQRPLLRELIARCRGGD